MLHVSSVAFAHVNSNWFSYFHLYNIFCYSQLKDTHTKICTTLGSDIAYSCYGKFLHSFVAGWEDDEKFKAYLAIKGLRERLLI